ncbi:GTP-binding protein [Acetitomaculum ruminis DSM 5522]|uniref:GTPase Obg n=1 Tax=Acetitomaculum ruminis DSM 5522 TaxID=1120918 RepID=A0A1I0VGM7_9FIRM|nr:GTPase ObgE [Acetitomaculum ruminis]SFA75639.1 GTP-binding protein [Acetitomaculum ruminis DSM 5522]
MFSDKVKVIIRSGKGGDGHVSFRREKFVANGGPDGGDGGKGGDLIFQVDEGLNTLGDFRYNKKYSAGNGETGKKRNQHGKNGEDLILKVPRGTLIRDATSGKIIADMSGENTRKIILEGGRGGLGNQHFATATMQAPNYAQPGKAAKEIEVILELKLIADVGLAGFPNVGKSTFLSRVTNAKPKIANYHFTTLVPNLGVVDLDGSKGFIIADIPGLIEGASEGLGLGYQFLRHIERTKVIVHMIDAASTEGRDPIDDIKKINLELSKYNSDLTKKPQIIAANKIDVLTEEEQKEILDKIKKEFSHENLQVYPISAVTGSGLKELLYAIKDTLDKNETPDLIYEQEFFPEIELNNETETGHTVTVDKDGVFVIEGPQIEKMLGYTNLEAEKGFLFFQNFLKEKGILDELKEAGINDGDTVRMYGWEFDYYD